MSEKPVVSVIDLGKLSEPATELIKVIGHHTGLFLEPKAVVKRAKAEAEAKIIEAKADIEVEQLKARALERWVAEETIMQANMESVVQKSLAKIDDHANPKDVDPDWLRVFFENARKFSNEEVQKLWARLLAEEVNEPGNFKRQTIAILSHVDREDIETINLLSRYVIKINGQPFLIIEKIDREFFDKHEMTYEMIATMSSLGILVDDVNGFYNIYEESADVTAGNQSWKLLPGKYDLGKVLLTSSGRQIFSLCDGSPRPDLVDYLPFELKPRK